MEFDWKRDISLDPKALDLRAGDGDRTHDVQLGKMDFITNTLVLVPCRSVNEHGRLDRLDGLLTLV
jgi:hypothetical protein